MNNKECIIHDNLHLLNETIVLMGSLTTETYVNNSILFNTETPTDHACQIIEYYELLFEGLANDIIDYGLRKTDLSLSNNPEAAMVKFNEIIDRIKLITCEDLSFLIDIKMDTGRASYVVQTTIGRELQFLWDHHVYHNRLIRKIIESSGEFHHLDFAEESCKVLEVVSTNR
jgi:hypothetical protein